MVEVHDLLAVTAGVGIYPSKSLRRVYLLLVRSMSQPRPTVGIQRLIVETSAAGAEHPYVVLPYGENGKWRTGRTLLL